MVVILAVVSPGFRYFALIAAALAGGAFYVLLENERKQTEESRKQQDSLNRHALELHGLGKRSKPAASPSMWSATVQIRQPA